MGAAPSAAVEQPEERSKPSPSGRLLLRMPAKLHAQLARAAEREGVSLNQFITGTLTTRMERGSAGPATAVDRRSRLVVAALIANVVVIGLAAAAAIAILVVAWQG